MDPSVLDPAPGQREDGLHTAEAVLREDPQRAAHLARTALAASDPHRAAHARLILGTAEYHQGLLEEALVTLSQARPALQALGETHAALQAALALGRVHRDLGQFDQAADQLHIALELARSSGDAQAEIDILNLQAGVYGTQGQYPRALDVLERALTVAGTLGLTERQANILNNMGTLRTVLGEYPQALEHLTAAHELFRRAGAGGRSQATNLIGLGHLYQDMGNEAEARQFYQQARQVGRDSCDPLVEAAALNNLANASLHAGDLVAARASFEEALKIARRSGARQYEIDNLDGLGEVFVASGDFGRAAETHEAALAVACEIGDREGEVDARLNLGRDALAVGHPERALACLQEALRLAEDLHHHPSTIEAHRLLADAFEGAGDPARALRHHRAFHRADKAIFNEENEKKTRQLSVQFEVERARHEAEESRLRSDVMRQARDEAEAAVRERTLELEEAQLEVVSRLAVAAEYRDDVTGEHTRRVGRNAALLARALGRPDDEVELLFTAARLHDVGKIGIPDGILHKPGRLEPDEMARMKSHATIGARILSGGHSRLLRMAEEIALSHHERWDGAGYPLGLEGEAIPLSARIVAVADVLDALTHERPYKRAWTAQEALAEIRRQSGSHFDPAVVEACVQVFGAGGLSPTDAPTDWHLLEGPSARGAAIAPRERGPSEGASVPASVVQRYERLLLERTRELEAMRREAQSTARNLQTMAFTDPLTGLGNRRAFEQDLEVEVSRASHQGRSVGVLALDLDSLKAVNDAEGHERGDALLRAFACAIARELREVGRVYRVGGDEFLAILGGTDSRARGSMREGLERVMRVVQASGFRGAGVSAGDAFFPEEVQVAGDLVRLSDQRMYRDKVRKRGGAGA